jgi:hypothetical protein
MTRRLAVLPLLALPLVAFAAPVPKGPAVSKEFGTSVDPDKDCTFVIEDGKLTITIPPTHHTLSTASSKQNAPRVLKDVEGDFTATVRVQAGYPDDPKSDLPDHEPGVAAGLVVWGGEGNFVCLIRLHEMLGQKRVTTNELHWQIDGDEVGESGPVAHMDTTPHFLRVTRSGGQVVGEASPDGKAWRRVGAAEFKGPSKVKVGVFLEHNSGHKTTGTFDKYEVKPAEKK